MTMIDEQTVGILYEGSQAHMTFQRIPLGDIIRAGSNEETRSVSEGSISESNGPSLTPGVTNEKLQLPRVFGNQLIHPAEYVGLSQGEVQCRERLGGLLRYYYRDAA